MPDLPPTDLLSGTQAADLLRGALIDSRQRWRELVNLGADFAFETDDQGHFVLLTPDPALGWPANALIGQPSAVVLADGSGSGVFNPFAVTSLVRHRQAWLKRGDGGLACLTFSAAPIRDASGRVTGTRGSGIDMTDLDNQAAQAAQGLRRSEILDHIMARAGREVLAPRMMAEALETLLLAFGAEGMAALRQDDPGLNARLVYTAGDGSDTIAVTLLHQMGRGEQRPVQTMAEDGRPVLLAARRTRDGGQMGLAAWRAAGARGWDRDDLLLIQSAAAIVRMILEHDVSQREMHQQARTDPLTGLMNRRAFLEEVGRHAIRLDKERLPGTLMFVDLDHFKPVNDLLGHDAGDQVLVLAAALLRETFRPGDLVARLGGDEFAVWMNGADHMTAAERAEHLRATFPPRTIDIVGPEGPRLTMSIGIASRDANSDETIDGVIRRADMAMYEVKRNGRGHWRVSLRAHEAKNAHSNPG